MAIFRRDGFVQSIDDLMVQPTSSCLCATTPLVSSLSTPVPTQVVIVARTTPDFLQNLETFIAILGAGVCSSLASASVWLHNGNNPFPLSAEDEEDEAGATVDGTAA